MAMASIDVVVALCAVGGGCLFMLVPTVGLVGVIYILGPVSALVLSLVVSDSAVSAGRILVSVSVTSVCLIVNKPGTRSHISSPYRGINHHAMDFRYVVVRKRAGGGHIVVRARLSRLNVIGNERSVVGQVRLSG